MYQNVIRSYDVNKIRGEVQMGMTSAFGDVDDAVNLCIFGGKGKTITNYFGNFLRNILKWK